jgi:hypothetical protein
VRKTAFLFLLILLPSLSFALGGVKIVSRFGGKGEGDGMFSEEVLWEFDAGGNIYVSDRDLRRVQKFAPDGRLLFKIEQPRENPPFRFTSISDIAVDSSGRIYLLDWKLTRRDGTGQEIFYDYLVCVHLFSSDGKFIRDIELKELGAPTDRLAAAIPAALPDGKSGFIIPHGDPKRELRLDVSPEGDKIFVLDGREIFVFDRDGIFLDRFGGDGLGSPVNIHVEGEDIWLVDEGNHRVVRLSRDGEILGIIGGYGYGRGRFIKPFWVSTLSDGSIEVLDRAVTKRFAPTVLRRRLGEPIEVDPDMPEGLIGSKARVEKVIFRRAQRFSRDGEFMGQVTIRLDQEDILKGGFEPICIGPDGAIYLQNSDTLQVLKAIPAHPLSEILRRSEKEVTLGLDLLRSEIEIDNPDDLDLKRDFLDQTRATGIAGGFTLRHDLDERVRAELSGFGYYAFYRAEDHYSRMDIRTRMNQDDKTLEEIGGMAGQINVDVRLSPEPYDYRTASFYVFLARGRYNFIIDALAPNNKRYLDWKLWYTDWGGGLRYSLSKNWSFVLSVLSTPARGLYDYEGSYIDEEGLLFATLAQKGRRTVVRFYLEGGLD